ncbi:MAG: hypothetical protein AAF403_00405 [Pseudomonadota bacterium]
MHNFNHYQPRSSMLLPSVKYNGWQIKRYAIFAKSREFDEKIIFAATRKAKTLLPIAGKIDEPDNNHGVGFQIIHFAETAIVSPVFYWMCESVLANTRQMRAQWNTPTEFDDVTNDIIGCVWELEIIEFEVKSWKHIMLCSNQPLAEKLEHYLNVFFMQ